MSRSSISSGWLSRDVIRSRRPLGTASCNTKIWSRRDPYTHRRGRRLKKPVLNKKNVRRVTTAKSSVRAASIWKRDSRDTQPRVYATIGSLVSTIDCEALQVRSSRSGEGAGSGGELR